MRKQIKERNLNKNNATPLLFAESGSKMEKLLLSKRVVYIFDGLKGNHSVPLPIIKSSVIHANTNLFINARRYE